MKYSYKTYTVPQNHFGALLATWLNKWQLNKAIRLAKEQCLADRKRRYVVPMFGFYVIFCSTDISEVNRRAGSQRKLSIEVLIEQALYIADYNTLLNSESYD